MTTVERIKYLAKQQGRSITFICKQLGYSSRTYLNDIEKNKKEIPTDKLETIADILNTSVDYLLGKTEETKRLPSPVVKADKLLKGGLSQREVLLLTAYREQPELQLAVDRLLGIEQDGQVYLYTAAYSDDKRADAITRISKTQLEQLQNAPETDDDLM